MKLSNRSSSLTIFQSDIYSRFLDMHEELSKSSKNINNLINHSLKQLACTKEEARFSLSANSQNQQELNSFEEMAIEEDLDLETQPSNNEKELILENKIKIYESSLIKFEQENLQKDQEILRLKKLLNDKNIQQTMQNPDEIYQEQSVTININNIFNLLNINLLLITHNDLYQISKLNNQKMNKLIYFIRQKLQILDGQLEYLQEKKDIRKKMKEWESIIKEQSDIINSQKLEISRLKHINSYLHKSIEKLQTL